MPKISCWFPKFFLKLNRIDYGNNLRLIGWPFFFRFPSAKIKIGDGVTINSNFWSNLLGLNHKTIIVARRKGNITVGDSVGMSGAAIYAWEEIAIGDNTLIGANTKIIDTDFHPIDPIARIEQRNNATKTAPVKIGKNVFIGMNTLILKGTQIGDNCVVGAGSVVCGRFESNCVIAGNPAKVVRKLYNDSNDLSISEES